MNIMSTCVQCGDSVSDDGSPYRCSYCQQPVCSEHRLPENHACTGVLSTKKPQEAGSSNRALPRQSRTTGWRSADTEGRRRDSAQISKQDAGSCQNRGKKVDKELPGAATESVAKSPDVNPDGSIDRSGETNGSNENGGIVSRLLFWR